MRAKRSSKSCSDEQPGVRAAAVPDRARLVRDVVSTLGVSRGDATQFKAAFEAARDRLADAIAAAPWG